MSSQPGEHGRPNANVEYLLKGGVSCDECLKVLISNWRALLQSAFAPFFRGMWTEGLDITYCFICANPEQYLSPTTPFASKYRRRQVLRFTSIINQMIDMNLCVALDMSEINRHFVHNRFSVPKADGTFCPVDDYSVLNEFVWCDKCKMDNLKTFCQRVQEGDWLYFWDLEKCYHQIPMSPSRPRTPLFVL